MRGGEAMHPILSDHLEDFLDDKLDEDQRSALLRHLEHCPPCQRELEIIRQHRAFLQLLRPPVELTPRPDFYPRVWQLIEQQNTVWAFLANPQFQRQLIAACILLIALLGGILFRQQNHQLPVNALRMTPIVLIAHEQAVDARALEQTRLTSPQMARTEVLVNLATFPDISPIR